MGNIAQETYDHVMNEYAYFLMRNKVDLSYQRKEQQPSEQGASTIFA